MPDNYAIWISYIFLFVAALKSLSYNSPSKLFLPLIITLITTPHNSNSKNQFLNFKKHFKAMETGEGLLTVTF